jgi:hypothetical protein
MHACIVAPLAAALMDATSPERLKVATKGPTSLEYSPISTFWLSVIVKFTEGTYRISAVGSLHDGCPWSDETIDTLTKLLLKFVTTTAAPQVRDHA